jgi:hypothetical protein
VIPQPKPLPPSPPAEVVEPLQGYRLSPGAARVIPGMPSAGSVGVYLVQVGAYLDMGHAQFALQRARDAGYSPVFERYMDYYRIVIPGVRAQDIWPMADRLGAAGFPELWIREESGYHPVPMAPVVPLLPPGRYYRLD